MLRVFSAEVQKSVALLGKAHLFNEAAHADLFVDMRDEPPIAIYVQDVPITA